ncbi:hypothetical protein [Nocardia sp. NPDC057227]|uniref:hypothetical protein n=1 Tax=Nocardia sp. NPDC057227 TaxID=3346056 RepID=UPI00363D0740
MSRITELWNAIKALPRMEALMGEVANTLNQVSDRLDKARGEILGELEALRTRLADAGKLDHEDQAALQRAAKAAEGLDGIVDDATPPPAEEPGPADPAPAEPVAGEHEDHVHWAAEPQEPTA